MAKFTQQAIQVCLLQLLQEKSIDKVSVKDICEKCNINRNTFYYYYSDIYAVLEELFKREIDISLNSESNTKSFYEDYLNRYHLVLEHRKAVWHIYDSKHRQLILKYFYTITENFVRKYVEKEAEKTNLTENDIKFITDFYSNSMIGNTLIWLGDGMKDNQEELIRKLSFSYQATIQVLIAKIHEDNQNK